MIFDNGAWAQGKRYRLKVVNASGGRTLVRCGTFVANEPRSRKSRKDPTTYAILVYLALLENDQNFLRELDVWDALRVYHAACFLFFVFVKALGRASSRTLK